jgi:2-methylcitrate dehydratase PrpD
MHKISAKKNPDLPSWGSKAKVVLNDGREFSSEFHAENIKGSPKNPLSKEEHVEKFRKCVPYCAFKLGDKEVDSIIDAILNLEQITNVEDAILKPLTT